MKKINLRHLKIHITVAAVIAIVLSSIFLLGFFGNYRNKINDKLYIDLGRHNDVVVVEIDDKTISNYGVWPLPRTVYSELITKLDNLGVKVIGLDMVFTENSQDQNADFLLADTVRLLSDKIILPVEIGLRFDKNSSKYVADFIKPPFNILSKYAAKSFVNTPLDEDSVFRSLPTSVLREGEIYEPFGLSIVKKYLDTAEKNVVVDRFGRMIVNFSKYPAVRYSALDVLSGNIDNNIIKNKIALIGATAANLHDEQAVPVSRSMSGVLIHANIINTILNDAYILPAGNLQMVALLFVLSVFSGLLIFIFKPTKSVIFFGLFFILYVIFVSVMFDRGIIFDLLFGFLALFLSYLLNSVLKLYFEQKEKKWIKNVFSRYLHPEVVDMLASHPEKLKLGGEKKEMSIMFSDIRGFTTISEGLKPEGLIDFLNKYLNTVTKVILDHNGTVDKYIGDAVMAFWGAPIDNPNHAFDACLTILRIKEKLQNFTVPGAGKIKTGFGLNLGEVVVGNVGSESRFDYTVIGDVVNAASRFEGLCKTYGVSVVVGESVFNKVKDKFVFRMLDKVIVKGKKEPIAVYELLSGRTDSNDFGWVKIYHDGMREYFIQNWDLAKKYFTDVLRLRPEDSPARIMIDRCVEFTASPPLENWSGEYIMKTK